MLEQTFDSKQYTFADITLIVGGQDLTNITSIEYTEEAEKTPIYGKSRNPIAIQRGQRKVSGKITVLQDTLETLILLSPNKDLLNVHCDAIISYGRPENGDVLITDVIHGLEFSSLPKLISNTDANMNVDLNFIALQVEHQKS